MTRAEKERAHVERQIDQDDLGPYLSVRRAGDRLELIFAGKIVAARPVETASELGLYVLGFAAGRTRGIDGPEG